MYDTSELEAVMAQPKGTPSTSLLQFIADLEKQPTPVLVTAPVVTQKIQVAPEALKKAFAYFTQLGVNSPLTLAEMYFRGEDFGKKAREAGIEPQEMQALLTHVLRNTDPDALQRIQDHVSAPKATGQIDWSRKEIREFYERQGIHPVREMKRDEFKQVHLSDIITHLVPRGPKKAVDLRPFLGGARNQGGRGTCAVHGAIAVAEAFEYFRDRRNGPINLSEQYVWWYRGGGQRYSAGGYDCSAALDDIREMGVCEEYNLPYQTNQINNNHTQVPIPDKAMDRAPFYRLGPVIGLPWGDVNAAKRVLESGRVITYASNLDGWNTGTGEITMPPAGTVLGGAHCTAIVGYIDKDGLPPSFEGGYFIIRNSWGGEGDANNILGPEYGGHLLMPYAWYRQYAGWPATTTDRNDATTSNQWLVEYYDNQYLKGAPLETRELQILFTSVSVSLPQTVANVDFNWGFDSPVKVTLPVPVPGNGNVLPVDHFSVRFTKVQRFREGWYRFHLRGDDGLRLYVDDRLVINQWKDQPSTSYTAEYHVTGGDHIIRVEYYEAGGSADVHLTFEPIQWHYELFGNFDLTGSPAASFDDTLTALEWRHQPPVLNSHPLSHGQFSLRGTSRLFFTAGSYRFHAQHTGRFRLYIDGVLQLDDVDGLTASSGVVSITEGMHDVRIEFRNTSVVPAAGSHSYYRAFCQFAWSQESWHARFYKNLDAQNLADSNTLWNNIDANYLFFRTCGLTGNVVLEQRYPKDPYMDCHLNFANWDSFKTGVTTWPTALDPLRFFGVWFNRKFFLPQAGYFNVTMNANEGFRVVIDGKEVLQNEEFIGNDPYNADIWLDRGVHDLSIEYNGTQWGGMLDFNIVLVQWNVRYFTGNTLSGTPARTTVLNSVKDIADKAGDYILPTNFSVIATRTVWMPVGKYYFSVRSDDGVRLKVNNRMVIDAWVDQAPTDYNGFYEHQGGPMNLRIEYYQGTGDKTLDLFMADQEFYGEYYNGYTLNQVPSGSSLRRIAPIAYRYETDINFDWGRGSHLPRVGAYNFSARWTGRVQLPVGRWRLEAISDDGIRVFVDGRLLIDSWREQGLTTRQRMIDLTGRKHDIRVEYFQKSGDGVCKLRYHRTI